MDYLNLSVINDFQAKELQDEQFTAKYGLVDLAKDSGQSIDYISPTTKTMMQTMSKARNAVLPVMKETEVTVGTVPGFENIPVNLGESGTYYFTAYDAFTGMRMFPASFENNMVDREAYFQSQMRKINKKVAETVEGIISTNLENRKTQVLNYVSQISQGAGAYTFNGTTDTLEISKAAQKSTMFSDLYQLMEANKLEGNTRIVTSPGGLVATNTEANLYRDYNEKNLGWAEGYMTSDRRYQSHQISTAANFNGFLVRDGDIGLIENFPWDFRNRTTFAGKEWAVSDVEMPYVKMRPNVYINKEATEATSLFTSEDSNLTMTYFEEMALWFRFYVPYRYNSDLTTRQNGVVKLLGLT
ncbi:MAG: hypothetical protein GY679_00070 [Mycoplasma sp.]|nr:hypothetical protein [Mycoplasma sp.]